MHRPEAALVPAAPEARRGRRSTSAAPAEPEFDQWRWVPYWEPVKEVIYFKRPVYARALTELADAGAFPQASTRRCRRGGTSSPARGAARPPALRRTEGALLACPRLHARAAATEPPLRRARSARRRCAPHSSSPRSLDRSLCALRRLRARPLQRGLRPPGRGAAAHRARGADRAAGKGQPPDAHAARGADTIRAGRAHEQAEVARAIGDLQAQVGAAVAGAGVLPRSRRAGRSDARREDRAAAHHSPAPRPATFIVHMSLVRSGRADTDASGEPCT